MSGHVLRDYQRAIVRYCIAGGRRAWLLFVEMRLGKTLCTIRALRARSAVRFVLVVAPYSALLGWREELERERLPYAIVDGSRRKRQVQLDMVRDYVVKAGKWQLYVLTNREAHRSVGAELSRISWDAIVLDESTFVKNPRAAVTKFWRRFPRAPRQIRVCLTGTPSPESALDYFEQLYFVDPTILGYSSYYEFRARCFHPVAFDWRMHKDKKVWLAARLAHATYQLKRTDVNLGGIKVYERRTCRLPAEFQRVYDVAEREFVLEAVDGDEIRRTRSAGVLYSWLRQIAGGLVKGTSLASRHKTRLLDELLSSELRGEQCVVWCQYVNELSAALEVCRNYGSAELIYGDVKLAERDRRMKRFQSGALRYLVCQPQTITYGARLDAAQTMIYYSTTESALTRAQTEDRIVNVARIGSVLIIDLVTEDTVDESIQSSLKSKESASASMTRMINNIKRRQGL